MVSKVGKCIDTEDRRVTRSQTEGAKGSCLKSIKISTLASEDLFYNNANIFNTTELHTLKWEDGTFLQ